MALIAGLVSRFTSVRGTPACRVLPAGAVGGRAAGVQFGSNVDLIHILFGTVLAVDDAALLLVGLDCLAPTHLAGVIYRPLLLESYDPAFCSRLAPPAGCIT